MTNRLQPAERRILTKTALLRDAAIEHGLARMFATVCPDSRVAQERLCEADAALTRRERALREARHAFRMALDAAGAPDAYEQAQAAMLSRDAACGLPIL